MQKPKGKVDHNKLSRGKGLWEDAGHGGDFPVCPSAVGFM